MKKIAVALFGLTAFCAGANAQVVTYDMGKTTCADYLAMDVDASRDFSAWMSGWFNQQAGSAKINVEGYRKNVASVRGWCASNPNQQIMGALKASVANAQPGVAGPTTIDVSQITCRNFLKADTDTKILVSSWVGGWFMGSKKLTVIDPRYVDRNSKVVITYCAKHGSEKLLSAVQKSWK